MKRFSAQYVITGNQPPLKRAVITTDDDGRIISIEDTEGNLREQHSTEFYNGIIIPGFVNCHCHLELSHMKGIVPEGTGLGGFIEHIRSSREKNNDEIISAVFASDSYMHSSGIVLCADICNTTDTFAIKKESRIKYINLLEVFGIDPAKAGKRMNEIMTVAEKAKSMGLPYSLVPHSAYSMSLTLLRLLKKESHHNKVTSIHFMETEEEMMFLKEHTGPLQASYERSGLIPPVLETSTDHASVILNEITPSGNLILVHNTLADREIINAVNVRNNLFWCICPGSNIYIENKVPPIDLLIEENCDIVMGTDSLASNSTLKIRFPPLIFSLRKIVTSLWEPTALHPTRN